MPWLPYLWYCISITLVSRLSFLAVNYSQKTAVARVATDTDQNNDAWEQIKQVFLYLFNKSIEG